MPRATAPTEVTGHEHVFEYLYSRGYGGIVIESWESEEAQTIPYTETNRVVLVAMNHQREFVRIHYEHIRRFAPRDGVEEHHREHPVGAAEYESVVTESGNRFLDTEKYRYRFAKREAAGRGRWDPLSWQQKELNRRRPLCKECGIRMTMRPGVPGPYWACMQRPSDCGGFRTMRAKTVHRIGELLKQGAQMPDPVGT